MAVKERTLTQEIAWRLAGVYAAQTHGNYDEETLFDRGGDWAADEVGKVLSERLGVPTEALEAGVVWKFIEEATETALALLDRIEALEQERDADRYRQQYEALRAGVERVAQNLLRRARTAVDNWERSGNPYYDGQADAFGEAEQLVLRLLD